MQHNGKQNIVEYINLPDSVDGITQETETCYIVLINADVPGTIQQHAIGHELCHIFENHFHCEKPISDCEQEAEEKAAAYYRVYCDSMSGDNQTL